MTARQLCEKERLLAHATRAVNVRRRPVASFQHLELPGERKGMSGALAFLLAMARVVFSWPVKS
jgi:hypothetical protein